VLLAEAGEIGSPRDAQRMAPSLTLAVAPVRYARHQPETTLLYQLVERHYPDFLVALSERDRSLPLYVEKEFEA
jgi:hypothetical protein